jgi:hypothetical protein
VPAPPGVVSFDPAKHPRDRAGRFRKVLRSLKVGGVVMLPSGVRVRRVSGLSRRYEVTGGPREGRSIVGVGHVASDALERADLMARLRQRGRADVGRFPMAPVESLPRQVGRTLSNALNARSDKAASALEKANDDQISEITGFVVKPDTGTVSPGEHIIHKGQQYVEKVGKLLDAVQDEAPGVFSLDPSSGEEVKHATSVAGVDDKALEILHKAAEHLPDATQDAFLGAMLDHLPDMAQMGHAVTSLLGARIDRENAVDSAHWTRARARELRLQERVEEQVLAALQEAYAEALHPRDRHGRWRESLGALARDQGLTRKALRKAFTDAVPDMRKALRRAGQPSQNIGITPYRGQSKMPDEYRESSRYRNYLSTMKRVAREENVRIEGIEHVDGLWQGEREPADSVWVSGDPEAVRRFGLRMGKKYNQDSVMFFRPTSKDAADSVLVTVPAADRERAYKMLDAMGQPGGRFVNGKVQAAVSLNDVDEGWFDRVRDLAAEQGAQPVYDWGHVDFPGRPYPDDLREGSPQGEAGGRPGVEAGRPRREARGPDARRAGREEVAP